MKNLSFDDIRNKGLLLYEYVRGSHAYGLQKPDGSSDIDTAGVFIEPQEWLLGLGLDCKEQISDAKNDNVWYALRKYMTMLLSSNPTVLESLFMPKRCVLYEHPIFTELKMNRDIFVTKDCFKPFIGYALEQIKKCRSLHKMFLFEDIERKTPLDFCYTFYRQGSTKINNWLEYRGLKQQYCGLVNIPNMHNVMGCYYDWSNFFIHEKITSQDIIDAYSYVDTTPTNDIITQLRACNDNEKHSLEQQLRKKQLHNLSDFIVMTYDLTKDNVKDTLQSLCDWYDNQTPIGYRGIINADGNSTDVRLSSVAKDAKPICYIHYNKDGYSKHCKDYNNQQLWKKNRNPERYKENKGKMFDRKNVAHAVRLLHMGKEIALNGEVNVDRTNIDRDFILDIRLGNTDYESIISYIEEQKDEMERLMAASSLPEHINVEQINNILLDINKKRFHL